MTYDLLPHVGATAAVALQGHVNWHPFAGHEPGTLLVTRLVGGPDGWRAAMVESNEHGWNRARDRDGRWWSVADADGNPLYPPVDFALWFSPPEEGR